MSPTLVALPNPFEAVSLDATGPIDDTTCFYFDAQPFEFEYEEGDSLEFAMPTRTPAESEPAPRPRQGLFRGVMRAASMFVGALPF